MKKFLFLFVIFSFFSLAPKASAVVISYVRTPPAFNNVDSGSGVMFSLTADFNPPGSPNWAKMMIEDSLGNQFFSGCVPPTGGVFTVSDSRTFFAPTDIVEVSGFYYGSSGFCDPPNFIDREIFEIGTPAFEITSAPVVTICPTDFVSDDSCVMYWFIVDKYPNILLVFVYVSVLFGIITYFWKRKE